MRLEIAERMRPFSHRPGVKIPLPGTPFAVQVFPALLRLLDLRQPGAPVVQEVQLPVRGPLADFTVQLDLERGCVVVWGTGPDGFLRYKLEGTRLVNDKGPVLPDQLPACDKGEVAGNERLWLGSARQLSEDRLEPRELIPLWLRLAAWMPGEAVEPLQGEVNDLLTFICQPLLIPAVKDELFQGMHLPQVDGLSPLKAVHGLAARLRGLFINGTDILPELPVEFHCGRFLRASCGSWGEVDFEWSKKQIRRLRFRAAKAGEWPLRFHKVASCRLRVGNTAQDLQLNDRSLVVQPGTTYLLDNFQH